MELLLSTFIYLSQWELISQRICLGKTVFCVLGIKSCSNFYTLGLDFLRF